MSRLTGWFGRGNTRALVLSAGVLALLVTPLAIAQTDGPDGATGQAAVGEGDPLEGGVRNPSNNQAEELQRETEIIAETDTYGTRQSNKSDNGGGAIYGCRSAAGGTPAGNEPCIRANNLSTGLAFEFESDGTVVGRIDAVGNGGDNTKPFTTNATGVADGLNADRVDGQNAAEITAAATAAAAQSAVQTGNIFANVAADGTLGSNRGATGAEREAEGQYLVSFGGNISGCGIAATQYSTEPGDIAVERIEGDADTVRVRTEEDDAVEDDNDPAADVDDALRDTAFSLTVTC